MNIPSTWHNDHPVFRWDAPAPLWRIFRHMRGALGRGGTDMTNFSSYARHVRARRHRY